MKRWGPGDFIVLAWGGFLGGFTFLFGTNFALKDAAWCITGETHCLREWVGALSGWAAFAGAVAALPYLAGQVREARRQTEFVVGDAPPTVTLQRPEPGTGPYDAVLTIVNWNRHPIHVEATEIESVPPGVQWALTDLRQVSAGVSNNRMDGTRTGGLTQVIDGWRDRQRPPNVFTAKVMIDPKDIEGLWARSLMARVRIRILGPTHEVATYAAAVDLDPLHSATPI
ncbi:hypothetical protein ACVOMV_24915 [Mesorhizobium atlanticum]